MRSIRREPVFFYRDRRGAQSESIGPKRGELEENSGVVNHFGIKDGASLGVEQWSQHESGHWLEACPRYS